MSDSPQVATPVQTGALWNWTYPASGGPPVVTSYPPYGAPTKSGVQADDLKNFVMVPIQMYGNPPTSVPDATINQWIRWAEDAIETDTNVRLCQTWIAAPAATNQIETQQLDFVTKYNYQQLGVDYDYSEAAYDFLFERWRDEAWGYQRLRWRPVQGVKQVNPTAIADPNSPAIRNIAFIYPLLNEFFRMPPTWVVQDEKRGLVRFVPAVDVQMLPIFALQLEFMGFAQSVPGGLWLQYTAGLTAADYQNDWSFMQQLVLARAAVSALTFMQTGINLGQLETRIQADGLSWAAKYSENGPFVGSIKAFNAMDKKLTRQAKMMGGGVFIGTL